VRALVDLALSCRLPSPPQITFISSISVVWKYPSPAEIPEIEIWSPSHCLPQGYSYAKHIAEQVLRRAVEQRPTLHVSIVRCGQLSGSRVTGAWPRSEHIPRLFQTSRELGVLPSDLDVRFSLKFGGILLIYMDRTFIGFLSLTPRRYSFVKYMLRFTLTTRVLFTISISPTRGRFAGAALLE